MIFVHHLCHCTPRLTHDCKHYCKSSIHRRDRRFATLKILYRTAPTRISTASKSQVFLHVSNQYINPINQFNQFANPLIDLLAKIELCELIVAISAHEFLGPTLSFPLRPQALSSLSIDLSVTVVTRGLRNNVADIEIISCWTRRRRQIRLSIGILALLFSMPAKTMGLVEIKMELTFSV